MHSLGLRTRRPRHVRNSFGQSATPLRTGAAIPTVSSASNACSIAIVGTVGIPASYGGFETLVENLARYHVRRGLRSRLIVYCSAASYPERPSTHLGAELRYIPLAANGVSSVAYDILSLVSAIWHGADVCLLLGVSGAIALPLIRLFCRVRIVTNIDGVEWKREKWKGFSKWFLRRSEAIAVRYSHEVIADNGAIARHVSESYKRACRVIAYGGDHAVQSTSVPYSQKLPSEYALALCRIEPENNAAMILEGFASTVAMPLVFIGNWANSAFGRELRQRYEGHPNLHLIDPIYDPGILRSIRAGAAIYVHGHSAGGTNPSLVEMMHFGVPIAAFDCAFNRFSTDGQALFFDSKEQLGSMVASLTPQVAQRVGGAMIRIAQKRYTWSVVGSEYFALLRTGGVLPAEDRPAVASQEVHLRFAPTTPESRSNELVPSGDSAVTHDFEQRVTPGL